jgi:hypothetical protein
MLSDDGTRHENGRWFVALEEDKIDNLWLCANPRCKVKIFQATFARFPACTNCAETPRNAVVSLSYMSEEK